VGSSTAVANARIGSTVAGKYRLNRLIGAGSMGAVYAAVHQFTGKHVALKLIDPSVAEYEGYAARFLREARAAADIGHPVICDVLDAGQEPDGSLYLALELLEGRTLEQAIDAEDLRVDEIVEVGIQLLDGLAAAHARGIVHRDIKPENVFLTWDEKGELHVKLLDFGVAKRTKAGPELFTTQQGAILGTPYYMAPEQAAGDPVDARADVWSTGAVLFHALTGQPPFDEETYNRLIAKLIGHEPPRLRDVRPELPEWLHTAVEGALQRDADVRWQSARTMAETLRLRGNAPIELDWEIHEDQTVRTDSVFDAGDDERPALRALEGGARAQVAVADMASIEVDLEQIDVDALEQAAAYPAFDGGGGPTIRSDVPPALMPSATPTAPPSELAKPGGSKLWLGVLLGALVTAVVALVAGWLVYAHVLDDDDTPAGTDAPAQGPR
jgi:serine/threonine protein kinase